MSDRYDENAENEKVQLINERTIERLTTKLAQLEEMIVARFSDFESRLTRAENSPGIRGADQLAQLQEQVANLHAEKESYTASLDDLRKAISEDQAKVDERFEQSGAASKKSLEDLAADIEKKYGAGASGIVATTEAASQGNGTDETSGETPETKAPGEDADEAEKTAAQKRNTRSR